MMQDESSSENVSLSRIGYGSSRENSISFLEIAKQKLKNYDDIDDNDFQMIHEKENINGLNINTKSYLQFHSLVVPIGTNFQADIPDICSAKSYLYKNSNSFKRVKSLKMHDPQKNEEFFRNNNIWIQRNFGVNVTYEDITIMKKNMDDFKENCTIQEYFSNKEIYEFWLEHFRSKDLQLMKRTSKKKKRKCGSMD